MTFFAVFLLAVALSMDAFAVAVASGCALQRPRLRHYVRLSAAFGFFQFAMPVIGWYLGLSVREYMESWDHWIAFVLLVFIGGKMALESRKPDEEAACAAEERLNLGELFVMAVATSIDALAVGITFALLPSVNIWSSITVIGITTFLLSLLGVAVGNRFGSKYQKKAELAGGIILILIGVKILLEHLGVIAF